jgi:hypothetical protein
MRNTIRLAFSVGLAVVSLSGLFARDAEATSCLPDAECRLCSPYGSYCLSLGTGQGYFCDDDCNCVPVTDPSQMPTVNCKI